MTRACHQNNNKNLGVPRACTSTTAPRGVRCTCRRAQRRRYVVASSRRGRTLGRDGVFWARLRQRHSNHTIRDEVAARRTQLKRCSLPKRSSAVECVRLTVRSTNRTHADAPGSTRPCGLRRPTSAEARARGTISGPSATVLIIRVGGAWRYEVYRVEPRLGPGPEREAMAERHTLRGLGPLGRVCCT